MNVRDIVKLQEDYKKLRATKQLTKISMCDLVIPFRDKYGLTDLQALRIARDEMPLAEMADLFEGKEE